MKSHNQHPSRSWTKAHALWITYFLIAAFLAFPVSSSASIIWSGDFETGDFTQYHVPDDPNKPYFWAMPEYCRPVGSGSYYGDGSCLSISKDIVREGRYAAMFTVKNSKNGREPDDCDSKGRRCERRRTELSAQSTLPIYYDAMPYMSERWMSVSHYVPEDWDEGGSGWEPLVFQVKPLNESGLSPNFAIRINGDTWEIRHRWSDVRNPEKDDVPSSQNMYYDKSYPSKGNWADGVADFPDPEQSRAALGSLNKGGWTDWVVHVKYDARGKSDGGKGFLQVWKREDAGEWVHVLDIRPRKISRNGSTFDRGVGYNSPASGSNNGGFGIKVGLYMHKDQVWNRPRNRVIYTDNVKVGSEEASFETMSPDGSSPDAPGPVARPSPPTELNSEY